MFIFKYVLIVLIGVVGLGKSIFVKVGFENNDYIIFID